jgi:hypothetical protein
MDTGQTNQENDMSYDYDAEPEGDTDTDREEYDAYQERLFEERRDREAAAELFGEAT